VVAVAGAQICFVGQHPNGTNETFLVLTHEKYYLKKNSYDFSCVKI